MLQVKTQKLHSFYNYAFTMEIPIQVSLSARLAVLEFSMPIEHVCGALNVFVFHGDRDD